MTALPPRADAIATVILGAPLLFPFVAPRVTVACGAAVVAIVVYQAIAGGARPRRTPLDWLFALFLFQALVGTVISPFPQLSISRLASIALGALVFRAVVLAVRTAADLEFATWLYVLAGTALGVAGLLGTSWPGFTDLFRKEMAIGAIALKLPRVVTGIPGATHGFHPNAIGGSTLLFIPLIAALIARTIRHHEPPRQPAARTAGLLVLTITLVSLALVLLFGQSRTAWLGLAMVSAGAVLWLLRSAVVAAVAAAAVVVAVIASGLLPSTIAEMRARPAHGALIPGETRPQLWARGLHDLRRHPITGIGLDTFRMSAREASPPYAGSDSVHVHNVFLQTALDVGIPGLIAFVGLLVVATRMWLAIAARGTPGDRLVAGGLVAGLAGLTLFGLYDAIVIGTKLSVCLWGNLGLLATLHHQVGLRRPGNSNEDPCPSTA